MSNFQLLQFLPIFIGPRCPKAETPVLQAAIEYLLKNADAAREALTDMPPRSENELDAVTLHNQALMNMELKPTDGFGKLQFLLQQNPFPPETFGNLLLLYCKYESVCCCQLSIFQMLLFQIRVLRPRRGRAGGERAPHLQIPDALPVRLPGGPDHAADLPRRGVPQGELSLVASSSRDHRTRL